MAERQKTVIIAGPCVIESMDILCQVAEELVRLRELYDVDFYFKASFDKANRTSLHSYRGPGMEKGLQMLQEIRDTYRLPLFDFGNS